MCCIVMQAKSAENQKPAVQPLLQILQQWLITGRCECRQKIPGRQHKALTFKDHNELESKLKN